MSGLLNVLAFDPSLNNLGMANGTIDLDKEIIYLHVAGTYYVDKLVNVEKGDVQLGLTRRTQQVEKVNAIAKGLIQDLQVDVVVTEEPVFGRNVDSLKGQIESISALRMAVIDFVQNDYHPLNEDIVIYYPGTIKSAVGAAGKDKASLKASITQGLERLVARGMLVFNDPNFDLHAIDEHGQDAIAMLVTKANELFIQSTS